MMKNSLSERDRILTELDRINTRVSGLNVTRLQSCAGAIYSCAQEILYLSASTSDPLPKIGMNGIGAQLMVITRDYLTVTGEICDPASDLLVADLLTQLRRDLP